jgi:hypothetical protein
MQEVVQKTTNMLTATFPNSVKINTSIAENLPMVAGKAQAWACPWPTAYLTNWGGHLLVNTDQGSSFKVLLTIFDSIADLSLKKVQKTQQHYDFSALSIMIVDDEPAIAATLKASMQYFNATVVSFSSSKEALSYFESESANIDVVSATHDSALTISAVLLRQTYHSAASRFTKSTASSKLCVRAFQSLPEVLRRRVLTPASR